MEKLTGKGKQNKGRKSTTEIWYHNQQVRGEYKCKILEMHLKLKDQQFKTILFIYRPLYQNLIITTN